ncbi:hypothetical protein ACFYYL_35235, partial [Actinomadura geliboluensis]|uniref:hypothetical protein n=1 Tax=Actinomadura geliboluensis TaxID=882440 RepID=UPI0036C5DC18
VKAIADHIGALFSDALKSPTSGFTAIGRPMAAPSGSAAAKERASICGPMPWSETGGNRWLRNGLAR